MYSRSNPSPRYRALLEQYRSMHVEGEKFLGVPPEKTFAGQSLLRAAERIKQMLLRCGGSTVLDYGAGKGASYRLRPVQLEDGSEWPSLQSYWGVEEIYCYDPCHEPFNRLPSKKYDGVISTDVLEHCPEDDVPWIVDEIFGYANRFVFANVACYPARKRLPNGENAHCTIRPMEWWHDIVQQTARRYPGITWEVWAESRVETSGGRRWGWKKKPTVEKVWRKQGN